MGNLQIQQVHNSDDLRSNSQLEGEIVEDFRYGSGLIVSSQESRFLFQTQTYTFMNQYTSVCEDAQLRMNLTVPTIVKLIRYNGSEYLNANGKSYKISLLYEFQMQTLQDDITRKCEKQENYSEMQLCRLIDHVLSGLLVFRHFGITHQFIQPSTIFITVDDIYKINDIAFMSGATEYKRFMNGQKENCFLSPKLFQELGQRVVEPTHNIEKSEIFSLGRTVLEAGLLSNLSEQLYDFNTFNIQPMELSEALHALNLQYSHPFCQLVQQMVRIDEHQRFGYEDTAQYLSQLMSDSISQIVIKEIKERTNQVQQANQRSYSPLSFRQNTSQQDYEKIFKPQIRELVDMMDQGTFGMSGMPEKSPSFPNINETKPITQVREKMDDSKVMEESRRNNHRRVQSMSGSASKVGESSKLSPSPKPKIDMKPTSAVLPPLPPKTAEVPLTKSEFINRNFKSDEIMKYSVVEGKNSDAPPSPLLKLKKSKNVFNLCLNKTSAANSPITPRKQSQIVQTEDIYYQQTQKQDRANQNVYVDLKKPPSVGTKKVIDDKITNQPIKNRLPQSDVIYLHSGQSQYINDIFCNNQNKASRARYNDTTNDFWL